MAQIAQQSSVTTDRDEPQLLAQRLRSLEQQLEQNRQLTQQCMEQLEKQRVTYASLTDVPTETGRRSGARSETGPTPATDAGAAPSPAGAEQVRLQRLSSSSAGSERGREDEQKGDAELTRSTSTIFVFAVFHVFLFFEVLSTAALLALVVLLGFEDYAYIPRSAAMKIFVLLQLSLSDLGFGWMLCYSSSPWLFLLFGLCHVVSDVLHGVWGFFVYHDTVALVFFCLTAGGGSSALFFFRRFFELFALPVDKRSLAIWLTSFRLFIIIVTPIVSGMIRNGGSPSMIPFYAMFTFATSIFVFSCTFALLFVAFPNADSVADIVQSLSLHQMINTFGGIVTMAFASMGLYLIVVSGSEQVTPEFVVIILLVVFLVGGYWIIAVLLALFSGHPLLSLLHILTPENRATINAARLKARHIRKLQSTRTDGDDAP